MARKGPDWNTDQPIYRQIRDTLVARIIDGDYPEGDLLPSVRQVAEEFEVAPLTAAKVFQELDKEDVVLKRRGIGNEVRAGIRAKLLARERKQFLEHEWPELRARLHRLEIDPTTLPS